MIGAYNNKINNRITKATNIDIDSNIFYICGVSEPFVWERNFHLALQHCEGNTVFVCRNGIRIIVKDAKEIMFNEGDIDQTLKESKLPAYRTCRNWQFANKYKKIFR